MLGNIFNAASVEYSLSMANVLKNFEENGIVKLPRYAVDKTSVILKSQCAFVRMVFGMCAWFGDVCMKEQIR